MSIPVDMQRSATRGHVSQVSAAYVTEEEASILKVHHLGLCRLPVQVLLHSQGQSLITVLGPRMEVWAEGCWEKRK